MIPKMTLTLGLVNLLPRMTKSIFQEIGHSTDPASIIPASETAPPPVRLQLQGVSLLAWSATAINPPTSTNTDSPLALVNGIHKLQNVLLRGLT